MIKKASLFRSKANSQKDQDSWDTLKPRVSWITLVPRLRESDLVRDEHGIAYVRKIPRTPR